MIDGQNLFDQLVKTDKRTYDNILKITAGQGDDYTTGCLLDYLYFKNLNKIMAIDLSKKQALDAAPKAIQQIKFTGNLSQRGGATVFFIIEETKETILDFSQRTVKVLHYWVFFIFIFYFFYFIFYFLLQNKMAQCNILNVKMSN